MPVLQTSTPAPMVSASSGLGFEPRESYKLGNALPLGFLLNLALIATTLPLSCFLGTDWDPLPSD